MEQGAPSGVTLTQEKENELWASALAQYEEKSILYTSSNPSAVSVSQDGVLTAVGGDAVITAQVEGLDIKAQFTVSVPGSVFVTVSSTKLGGCTPKTLPL